MTQYNSLNVKLSNSQQSSNKIDNSHDKINFRHKLLLTNRQTSNLCKALANYSSADIKLSNYLR